MRRLLPILVALVAVGLLVLLLTGSGAGPERGPAARPVERAAGGPAAPPALPEPPPPRAPDAPRTGAATAAPPPVAPSSPGAAAAGAARRDGGPADREPRDPPGAPDRAPGRVLFSLGVELAGELEGAKVGAMVFRADPEEKTAPVPVPVRNGHIEVPPLPKGDYRLEVAAVMPGRVVRKQRKFTVGAGPVSVEPLRILPDAGIRARAVDADGQPIPQATVVVVRENEDPEKARRLTPGPGGWFLYGDLEPTTYHHVVVLGLPRRLEQTVRTPDESGEVTELELKAEDRLVLCRFTLRLPEGAPKGGLVIRSGPVRPTLRPDERELTVTLLPGTYRFRVGVTGRPGTWQAQVVVPATGPLITNLDFLPE